MVEASALATPSIATDAPRSAKNFIFIAFLP